MRKQDLDPLIDRAEATIGTRKPREVWEELARMAADKVPADPLLGFVPDKGITFKGPSWEQSRGAQPDVLTFAGLRARLWRRSKVAAE